MRIMGGQEEEEKYQIKENTSNYQMTEADKDNQNMNKRSCSFIIGEDHHDEEMGHADVPVLSSLVNEKADDSNNMDDLD